MKKHVFNILIILIVFSCKNKAKSTIENTMPPIVEVNSKQEALINKLTLNDSFKLDDVRRYGIFPNQGIGTHPLTGNKKMDELLNLAEQGVKLTFPKGLYKTTLDLSKRKNITLSFDKAEFTGAIIIKGQSDNITKNITLKGTLISYSSFFISFTDNVKVDRLIIKNDKSVNISGNNSSGCNIYTGVESLYINYLRIEGTGSDGDQYNYTPAALMIHGKSPAPNDILIKQAIIKSSDRHGAYLSGKIIEIEKITIESYAQGKIENMIQIAHTINGDEKKITGIWLNDFENSIIEDLTIDTSNSPKATDAIYLDSGDSAFPSEISKVEIKGNKTDIRKVETTNVEISNK